jgi:hypothetical protein
VSRSTNSLACWVSKIEVLPSPSTRLPARVRAHRGGPAHRQTAMPSVAPAQHPRRPASHCGRGDRGSAGQVASSRPRHHGDPTRNVSAASGGAAVRDRRICHLRTDRELRKLLGWYPETLKSGPSVSEHRLALSANRLARRELWTWSCPSWRQILGQPFKAYYARLRDRELAGHVAIGHVAGKLISVLAHTGGVGNERPAADRQALGGRALRRRRGSRCVSSGSRRRSASASSGWWTSAFPSCATSGRTRPA